MINKNIPLNSGMQDGLQTEVAIVGAGLSGLYTAYRLMTGEGKPLPATQVQIFDLSNRIAGRLESAKLPGMDVIGELGGMRYLTSQQIVTTLIEEVFKDELTNVDFPMGDTAKLFMYLRKQRLKQNAWEVEQGEGKKLQTNYLLNEDDFGYNNDQLFNKIIYDVLMADPWYANNPKYKGKATNPSQYNYNFTLTSREWDEIKPQLTYCFEGSPYNGRKVNDIGFWNLIKDQVSQEGYSFLANAGGYYSNTINWNAAEAFPYMVGDFSGPVKYRTIEQGYDSIAYALANAYLAYEGACIWSENKLLTFSKNNNGTYKYQLSFLNIKSNKTWSVYANKIVLAMPRQSLELLDQYNFFFNADERTQLGHNIESVIKEPSFKILMGFEYPWWKAPNVDIDSGHSITDLPLRQCYYFGTDPNNQHSLLLGSYGDMETETFWKALSEDRILFTPKATASASLDELRELNDVQATQMMVDEVMNQLREVHGPDVKIPEPYVTWFKDWTDMPFGAGYHAWKAGYSVKDVMEYMRRPLPDEQIYICGEAYSDQQGWVEGAFCVAEHMLQDYFGLDWPSWLDEDYYLGW